MQVVKLSKKVSKAEKMLRQEIEILQELNHPNIITYIDSFETQNRLACVLELCDGGTLGEFISNKNQFADTHSISDSDRSELSDDQTSEIMRIIFSAVSYLHSKGIVHRDLKPENILFRTKGDLSSIKLIDFGLTAKYDDACPMSLLRTHCGTVLYMAPEIAMKQEYSKSIDVWSLGIIMYNLVSWGEHPLNRDGDSVNQVKKRLEDQEVFKFNSKFSDLAKNLIK